MSFFIPVKCMYASRFLVKGYKQLFIINFLKKLKNKSQFEIFVHNCCFN